MSIQLSAPIRQAGWEELEVVKSGIAEYLLYQVKLCHNFSDIPKKHLNRGEQSATVPEQDKIQKHTSQYPWESQQMPPHPVPTSSPVIPTHSQRTLSFVNSKCLWFPKFSEPGWSSQLPQRSLCPPVKQSAAAVLPEAEHPLFCMPWLSCISLQK